MRSGLPRPLLLRVLLLLPRRGGPVTALYVAGPMSGLPDYNYPAFRQAAADLRAVGYSVENPAENDEQPDWVGYMRESLRQISRVDGIAVLDGWQLSRGATLEVHVAHALLLPVLPVAQWLSTKETTR